MMVRKSFVHLVFISILALTVSVGAQPGWVKLGQKDVNFSTDHDTITVGNKGTIKEVRFSVRYAPVKFQKVVVNYKDGQHQDLPFLEEVQVGTDSRALTIEGDGHPIKSIDLWYETNTMSGKKAKITAFGMR